MHWYQTQYCFVHKWRSAIAQTHLACPVHYVPPPYVSIHCCRRRRQDKLHLCRYSGPVITSVSPRPYSVCVCVSVCPSTYLSPSPRFCLFLVCLKPLSSVVSRALPTASTPPLNLIVDEIATSERAGDTAAYARDDRLPSSSQPRRNITASRL